MEELTLITRAFAVLFFVVDPMAAVPVFLTMTEGEGADARKRYARNATLTATIVLVFFLFFGQAVFNLFSVTLTAFRIAGGLILLILSLDLLKATHTGVRVEKEETIEGAAKADISITPLGVPMLGGPGAISSVMVLSSQQQETASTLAILAAILLTGLVTFVVLRSAEFVLRLLGVTGINVISRLMGLLLLAMAVQFLLAGFREAVPYILGTGVTG